MIYSKADGKIIIHDCSHFDIEKILLCGQVFRFGIRQNGAVVYSADKKAEVIRLENTIEILTDDVDYFVRYFDLDRDYDEIFRALAQYEFMRPSLEFGKGLRILKQDLLEGIVSFIISANNNISRIRKSIFYICEHAGKDMGGYYTFPNLDTLKKCDVQFFVDAGLGYRAEQMCKTLQYLTEDMLRALPNMDTDDKQKFLLTLCGVGEKVADCVMLFSADENKVFPVDTWIEKVYRAYFGTEYRDRSEIRRRLISTFGELSGVAQQYLFYYFRENKLAKN